MAERRIPAYNVRTVLMNHKRNLDGDDRGNGGKRYKDFVIQQCDLRNDKLGEVVRGRVLGAVSDLHAADARYHLKCRNKFFKCISVNQHQGDQGAFFVSVLT